MAMQWRSAGDMPAEGILLLVRLQLDSIFEKRWPGNKTIVTAAYVRHGFFCFADDGDQISGTHLISGWVPMAEAVKMLNTPPTLLKHPEPTDREIGTGAEALAREEAAQDPDEPCRVRRVFDGKYLEWDDTGAAAAMYSFVSASVFPRVRAAAIANAMIVLTGEHDIEVEPVGR